MMAAASVVKIERGSSDTDESSEDGHGPNHASVPVPDAPAVPTASGTTNRISRNLAEKMRRDKFNTYISELSALVPMVSASSKKMDKTSVLRLSATFLRMNHLVRGVRNEQQMPRFMGMVNWMDLLLDDVGGIMLIATSTGKIIFISHNIEQILGHMQIELFGQSLFNVTCPEDHEELKRGLNADEENDMYGDESSHEHHQTSRALMVSADGEAYERQRRSFYLRLRHRCVSRSEQPQYELFHIVGYLRVPKTFSIQVQRRLRKHRQMEMTSAHCNEIVLVATMKPFRERRVTEVSLLEATRDEYVTRHLLDGRIIYTDQRISVISGYLPDEVSGSQAFTFMHKDDVRWVLIALRQMLYEGQTYGSSCYRLKTKTGEFIYLKTFGYLEMSPDSDTYSSYICVNALLSEEEGERELRSLKTRFSPLIENCVEPGITTIAERHVYTDDSDEAMSDTENPAALDDAIRAMITNIPPPRKASARRDDANFCETQFAKAKLMSKALPPLTKQAIDSFNKEKPSTVLANNTNASNGKRKKGPTIRTNILCEKRIKTLKSEDGSPPSSISESPPVPYSAQSSSTVSPCSFHSSPNVPSLSPAIPHGSDTSPQSELAVSPSMVYSLNNGTLDDMFIAHNGLILNGHNGVGTQQTDEFLLSDQLLGYDPDTDPLMNTNYITNNDELDMPQILNDLDYSNELLLSSPSAHPIVTTSPSSVLNDVPAQSEFVMQQQQELTPSEVINNFPVQHQNRPSVLRIAPPRQTIINLNQN